MGVGNPWLCGQVAQKGAVAPCSGNAEGDPSLVLQRYMLWLPSHTTRKYEVVVCEARNSRGALVHNKTISELALERHELPFADAAPEIKGMQTKTYRKAATDSLMSNARALPTSSDHISRCRHLPHSPRPHLLLGLFLKSSGGSFQSLITLKFQFRCQK